MSDLAKCSGTTLTIDLVEIAERMTKSEARQFVQAVTHLSNHIIDAVLEQVVEGECGATQGWLGLEQEAELRAKLEAMMPLITARHVATLRTIARAQSTIAYDARQEARAWEKVAGILAGWLTTEAPGLADVPQRVLLGRAGAATSTYHRIGRNSDCHLGRLIRDAQDYTKRGDGTC